MQRFSNPEVFDIAFKTMWFEMFKEKKGIPCYFCHLHYKKPKELNEARITNKLLLRHFHDAK